MEINLETKKEENPQPRRIGFSEGNTPLKILYFAECLLYPDGHLEYLKGWSTVKKEDKFQRKNSEQTFFVNKQEDIEIWPPTGTTAS